MMNVDDHFTNAEGLQAFNGDVEQRTAVQFDERFGTVVGQWPQPGSKTRGEDHCPHLPIFSRSMCRTMTSTPLRARRRLASCSARKTERCCPPVHPNETIRFSKPRRRYSLTLESTRESTPARNWCTLSCWFR